MNIGGVLFEQGFIVIQSGDPNNNTVVGGKIGIGTSSPQSLLHIASLEDLTDIFKITGDSGKNLLRVKQNINDPLDDARVTIGYGTTNKPEGLARDQLYVYGRINSSWANYSNDFSLWKDTN